MKLPRAKEKLNMAREAYESALQDSKQGTLDVLSRKEYAYNDAIDHLYDAIVQFNETLARETQRLQ